MSVQILVFLTLSLEHGYREIIRNALRADHTVKVIEKRPDSGLFSITLTVAVRIDLPFDLQATKTQGWKIFLRPCVLTNQVCRV